MPQWIGGGTAPWADAGVDTGVESGPALQELWIGEHTVDQDLLVFDPTESDPFAEVITLYSLTQHRPRSFLRPLAVECIRPVLDELARARARKDYAQRDSLRDSHLREVAAAREERLHQVRERIVAMHKRFVEELGLTYGGVVAADEAPRSARVTKCRACGVEIDGFVGVVCARCSSPLCSCGACRCKR